MSKKIKSVIELAKYRTNDILYWLIVKPKVDMPQIAKRHHWMVNSHPKSLYQTNPYKKCWPYKSKLPKLHNNDFHLIVDILRSDVVVEDFVITDIIRSTDTGEFYYSNENDEWTPEENLFDTSQAAEKEVSRIKKLINNWSSDA